MKKLTYSTCENYSERFSEYSLTINLQKCKFVVTSIDYLGHHIDSSGYTPLREKLTAIHNFPKPSNMRQLRRFVGIIAFSKKFIPKCAEIMRPIYALLSPQRYSKKAVLWNDEAEKAFHEIIAKINSLLLLRIKSKMHLIPCHRCFGDCCRRCFALKDQ